MIIKQLIIIIAVLGTLFNIASANKPKKVKIVEYKVKSGDILYSIAHSHHTTIKEVQKLNGLTENDNIRVGQILKVPVNTYFPDKTDKAQEHSNNKKKSKVSKNSQSAPLANKSIYHIVKSGETLGAIAHKYGLKTGELKRLNGMDEDNYIIRVGMKLKIAKAKPKREKKPVKKVKTKKEIVKVTQSVNVKKSIVHTVKRGDTLAKIANKYDVNIKDIRKINHIRMGTPIHIGQKIKILKSIKEKKTKSIEVTIHRVKKGEKLSTIAKKYHMSIDELKEINKLGKSSKIHKGMKLKVAKLEKDTKSKRKDNNTNIAKSKKVKVKTVKKQVIKVVTHKVKRGEKLSTIAKKYNMSVDDLREINKLTKKSRIHKGMKLKVVKLVTVEKQVQEPVKKSKTTQKSKISQKRVKDIDISSDELTKDRLIAILTSDAMTPKIKKLIRGEKYYTVGDGDMLFSIARKKHVSLKELMRLNGIGATDIIKPGQKLKIPLTDDEKKLVARAKRLEAKKQKLAKLYKIEKRVTKHKVRHGETLWKIAKKYGVKTSDIRRLNHLTRKSVIHKNMVLVIKKETLVIPREIKKTYIVKRGDTLWKIAHKNRVSIAEIKKWNKLGKKTILHKGMKLTLILPNAKPLKDGRVKTKTKVRVAKNSKSKKAKKRKYASRKKSKHRSNPMDIFNSHSNGANVIRIAKRYLGRRYVWGAEGPNQFDCSGFTQYVMKKSKGIKIPRVSRRQAYYGKYVSMRNLKPGDLIFFDTSRSRRGYVNHVGIYIGNHKFIHASSARHRVVITSLNRPFYRARFKWGRRIN